MIARTTFAYITVAGICILLHNLVLIGADSMGLSLWLAVIISFCVVASVGYVLHGLFTFRQPLGPMAFARYALAMSANIPLAYVMTWLWHDQGGLAMPLAAPLASMCMLAVNFILGRWAIARPAPRAEAKQ